MGKTKTRILLIDDEKDFVFFIKSNLEATGSYEVVAVYDGVNGLLIASKDNIDIILLDILMPGMNGFRMLEELKSAPATKHIPVVVVTALHSEISHQRALALGAVRCLEKPFEIKTLISTIEDILKAGR